LQDIFENKKKSSKLSSNVVHVQLICNGSYFLFVLADPAGDVTTCHVVEEGILLQ